MQKILSGVLLTSLISVGTAVYLEGRTPVLQSDAPEPQQVSVAKKPAKRIQTNSDHIGRVARIKMDRRGHFVTKAKMNGRSIEVLVDTGATSVAINEKTARKLGIHLKASDYKHKVSTANGIVKAASATIEKVQIGRVTVRNVRTAVIQGKGLGGTLLGMSFLGQLKEFKIKNGELVMRQ